MDIVFECKKTLHTPASHTSFSLEVSQSLNFGDFLALFGKSGAGKTTLLRSEFSDRMMRDFPSRPKSAA